MGATSVTGKGLGMSHGQYKPDNQCGGCGCGCGKNCPTPPPKPPKTGCYRRASSNGRLSYKRGGGVGVRGC